MLANRASSSIVALPSVPSSAASTWLITFRCVMRTLENGLLVLRLEREIPEEKKPRQIAINGKSGTKLIGGSKNKAA